MGASAMASYVEVADAGWLAKIKAKRRRMNQKFWGERAMIKVKTVAGREDDRAGGGGGVVVE